MKARSDAWTPEEDQDVLRMRAEQKSLAEISEHLRYRSIKAIQTRISNLQGVRPAHRPFTASDDEMIQSLTRSGYNTDQIASVMAGRTSRQICERQKALLDYTGYTLEQLTDELQVSRDRAYDWLFRRGYELVDGVIAVRRTVAEVEEEIARRLAAAPPSGPCWQCEAARGCEHRVPVWTPESAAA